MIDVKGIPLQQRPVLSLSVTPKHNGLNEAEGQVAFHIDVRICNAEMRDWSAQKITDFFNGVAQVISARGKPK